MALTQKDVEHRLIEELYHHGYINNANYKLLLTALDNEDTTVRHIRTDTPKGFKITWEIELVVSGEVKGEIPPKFKG